MLSGRGVELRRLADPIDWRFERQRSSAGIRIGPMCASKLNSAAGPSDGRATVKLRQRQHCPHHAMPRASRDPPPIAATSRVDGDRANDKVSRQYSGLGGILGKDR
jgi:hypothetical protein